MKIIKFVAGGEYGKCLFHSKIVPFCDVAKYATSGIFPCTDYSIVGGEMICVEGNFILEDLD